MCSVWPTALQLGPWCPHGSYPEEALSGVGHHWLPSIGSQSRVPRSLSEPSGTLFLLQETGPGMGAEGFDPLFLHTAALKPQHTSSECSGRSALRISLLARQEESCMVCLLPGAKGNTFLRTESLPSASLGLSWAWHSTDSTCASAPVWTEVMGQGCPSLQMEPGLARAGS